MRITSGLPGDSWESTASRQWLMLRASFLVRIRTEAVADRKSTRLNSSHPSISYAVFCLKKKPHHLCYPSTSHPLGPTKERHFQRDAEPPDRTPHHHTDALRTRTHDPPRHPRN